MNTDKKTGLYDGKMGVILFLFNYARHTGKIIYQEAAGELLDSLYEELNDKLSVRFSDGLSGIGWGLEYLVQHGFLEGDTDEQLREIDNVIIHEIYIQSITDIGLDNGIVGLGRYIVARILPKQHSGDTNVSLQLKENLIYLIDWLDRQFDISQGYISDVLDFLFDLRELGFYKSKVQNMITRCIDTSEGMDYLSNLKNRHIWSMPIR